MSHVIISVCQMQTLFIHPQSRLADATAIDKEAIGDLHLLGNVIQKADTAGTLT